MATTPLHAEAIRALLAPAVSWYLEIESKVDLGEAYDEEWDDSALKALQALAAFPSLSPSQHALASGALASFQGYLSQDYDYNFLYEAKVPLRRLATAVSFDFDAAEQPYRAALSEQEARERALQP